MMRVVVTRPADQAGAFGNSLRRCGFEPVFFPTIRIASLQDPSGLDAALEQPDEFDWIIFTSANAVDAVCDRLAHLGQPFPVEPCVAAIGSKTAARLAGRGVEVDFIPGEFVAEAIVPGLGDLGGKRVLLPLADLAEDTLAEAVAAAGGQAASVTAYQTEPAETDPQGLVELQKGVDAVTFTSGSTVRNFITLLQATGLDPFALPGNPIHVCIGPKTAAVARSLGLRVDLVAKEHTEAGLLEALLNGGSR